MRVLIAITRADTLGGAQLHVRNLAVALRAVGHAVLIVTGPRGPFNDMLARDGFETWPCPAFQNAPHPARDMTALRFLRKAIRRFRPDLVSLHSSKVGLLGRVACRLERVPGVFTAHSWPFKERSGASRKLYQLIERLVSCLGHPIICVSEDDRRAGLAAGLSADRLTVVHNGVPDTATRVGVRASEQPPVRVAMVARLDAPKDHRTLLEAVAGVSDIQVDLIGDGPLRAQLEAEAATLGVVDVVRFLGRREDVEALLIGADMFVLSSRSEGFPLSTLEAMRAGLPVVVTDAGGAGEAFEDGISGFLVPPGDVAALRDRIGRLAADGGLRERMGRAARKHYEAHFTLDAMTVKTLAVYDRLLGGALEATVSRSQEAVTWEAS